MKQAVIAVGGKQYIVQKDEELNVELIGDKKQLTFQPLLVFDDKKTQVGTPLVSGAKVTAQVVDPEIKGEKVVSLRYKPKKRVRVKKGHRQRYSRIKITGIA